VFSGRNSVTLCFSCCPLRIFLRTFYFFSFKLYLFYNDYETSYTTFINHARWHRCLRSDCLRVEGNRSARGKTNMSDLVTTSHFQYS